MYKCNVDSSVELHYIVLACLWKQNSLCFSALYFRFELHVTSSTSCNNFFCYYFLDMNFSHLIHCTFLVWNYFSAFSLLSGKFWEPCSISQPPIYRIIVLSKTVSCWFEWWISQSKFCVSLICTIFSNPWISCAIHPSDIWEQDSLHYNRRIGLLKFSLILIILISTFSFIFY